MGWGSGIRDPEKKLSRIWPDPGIKNHPILLLFQNKETPQQTSPKHYKLKKNSLN